MEKRSVLMVSGGVESLVVTALFREMFPSGFAHAIHVHYGQKPYLQEARAVRRACERYGVTLVSPTVDLPWLEDHAMVDEDRLVCGEDFAASVGVGPGDANIVPFRNLAFLGLAAMYAGTVGASEIWTGFDYNPNAKGGTAKDKSPEFVRAMDLALAASSEGGTVSVVSPLQGNSKVDSVRRGQSLKVDWSMAWSCYNDYPKHCGVCGSCSLRMGAFKELGLSLGEVCDPEFMRSEVG
jgi:7-cyano-7-deazaguanine synthase